MENKQITTITKKEFAKLSEKEQRIKVAEDVLYRIGINQLKGNAGKFCEYKILPDELVEIKQMSERLKSPDLKCDVCAKGGLFLSYIGIVNNYESPNNVIFAGHRLYSNEMSELKKVFDERQLTMIETAFEGEEFSWNINLTSDEYNACYSFYLAYKNDNNERLIAICKNIVKHGEFNPFEIK